MNYSTPKFNTNQLYKKNKQFINNAYNQVAYIQKECKPFLRQYQENDIQPFFINKLLKFVCNTELQTVPFLDHDYYINLSINPKGRYAVFPAGIYTVYNKQTKELITTPITENVDIVLCCNRFYVMETPLFNSIELILKTIPLTVSQKDNTVIYDEYDV